MRPYLDISSKPAFYQPPSPSIGPQIPFLEFTVEPLGTQHGVPGARLRKSAYDLFDSSNAEASLCHQAIAGAGRAGKMGLF